MSEGLHPIPNSWLWTRVDEAGLVQLGRQRSPQHHSGEHMRPYLRVANVYENRIDTRDILEMNFTPAEAERYLLAHGDILLNEGQSKELVGRPAMFRNEVPGACFQNTLVRFKAHKHVVPEYALSLFRYYLRAGHFQKVCKWTTNIAHLGAERFSAMPFPLAPLAEQKRIADKLDALLARVDACRERLDRVPGILKRFRQSVLAAATSGELTGEWREANANTEPVEQLLVRVPAPSGKDTGRAAGVETRPGRCGLSVGPVDRVLPAGWQCVPLMRLAKLESGHTPSRTHPSYWSGDIPWIGIKDARDHHGKVITRTIQAVTQQGVANSAARLLPAGTVCLSRTASVGYVTIMGESMATSQDFANWVCTPALMPEYLMYAFLAEGEGLRDFGEGTTHTTIYYPELKALHICLPPVAEQAAIVARAAELLSFADRLGEHLVEATASVNRVAPAALAKAFRGELVAQDPTDEPASELIRQPQRSLARSAIGAHAKRAPRASAVGKNSPRPSARSANTAKPLAPTRSKKVL